MLAAVSLLEDPSDDDEPKHGGSRPGKAPNKARDFQAAYDRLTENYFSGENSKFDERDFERRFRMPRDVFNRVRDAVIGEVGFVESCDAIGRPSIHPFVKLVACLRRLAYGSACDREDEIF